MEMSARRREILKAVVEDYVETAEPVGSKSLVERRGLNLSPATVRSEMAGLESLGLLEQPHASAGRVPSPQGYRYYVNELMGSRSLLPQESEQINRLIGRKIDDLDRLLSEAGKLLSRLTSYAAVALPPSEESVKFSRVELFLPDPRSMVCVAVTESGSVRTKRILLAREGSDDAAKSLSAAINGVLAAGQKTLDDRTFDEIACIAGEGARFLPAVSAFLRECAAGLSEREVFVTGAAKLLELPEFKEGKGGKLVNYLVSDTQDLGAALSAHDDKPRVIIGPENAAAALKDSSVVMASIPMGGQTSGLIGIVGPTRMDYGRLVAQLDYFASKLRQTEDGHE